MNDVQNTTISFRVPVPLRDELAALADRSLVSVSDICRRSILDIIREARSPSSSAADAPSKKTWKIGKRITM